jgi:hypothetical protein
VREPLVRTGSYLRAVPEISRFYGIVITINYNDHAPPHFHARYGGSQATVSFDGQILAGSLPPRAAVMVSDWALLHRGELEDDWDWE